MGRKGLVRGRHLLPVERIEVFDLVRSGWPVKEVAGRFGCSEGTVYLICQQRGQPRRRLPEWVDNPRRLSVEEREEIRAGLAAGLSFRAIARMIERSPSTVSREVERNGGRAGYLAVKAHRRARRMARRPKPSKLQCLPRLRREVFKKLRSDRSPEQISARLKIEFPDDEEMRISPETIYQSIYIQARGKLRKDLAKHLRTGRTRRKARDVPDRRGQLQSMVMISERPAEVEDRAVPGHWEGDLIVGKSSRSFVGTLVERHTRFVMLVHLGHEKNTETVCEKVGQKILTLPENLRASLTWDQGREMAAHVQFTQKTGIPVFFCDPHSPWQRGSNENTNGLLRQYLPKGADLAEFDQVELDQIAARLNDRPRKTLDWLTPAEKLNEVLLR